MKYILLFLAVAISILFICLVVAPRQEKKECIRWQAEEKSYQNYIVKDWQVEQCSHYNLNFLP